MAALRCFRPSSSPESTVRGSERLPCPPPSFAPRAPPALAGAALLVGAGTSSFRFCPPTMLVLVLVLVLVLAIVLGPVRMLALIRCCSEVGVEGDV